MGFCSCVREALNRAALNIFHAAAYVAQMCWATFVRGDLSDAVVCVDQKKKKRREEEERENGSMKRHDCFHHLLLFGSEGKSSGL